MIENTYIPVTEDNKERFTPEIEEVDLEEFVKMEFASVDQENREEEMRRHRKWAKNRAFYRGNQRGFWDSKKRTWVSVDIDSLSPSEQSVLVVNNQFRPQVKTLAKEFSRSVTRVRSTPISDSQQSVLTSRFSDALIRYYPNKLMPETVKQLEAKYMFLCGNSFRYTYYDPNKKSIVVQIPKTGTIERPAYKVSVCPDCGYKTSPDSEENEAPESPDSPDIAMPSASMCPECTGVMEQTELAGDTVQGIVGTETRNSGDPVTEIVDPVEIKVWAGAHCLEESPYLRRKRLVKKEFLLGAFPFYVPSKPELSESGQLQYQFLDTSTTNSVSPQAQDIYEFDQLWLEPTKYKNKKLKNPVTFKIKSEDGYVTETIPAGTIIEEKFPDGLLICKVGEDIIGYYPENKQELWLHIPFDINVDGFWADGLEDSVMNQQIINEYTSLSVENVLYNASPKLIINPNLINPVTVTGRPKDMLSLSDNARTDTEPSKAFAQISGMSLTQEVMMGIESSKRDMREQTGALLGFNGQGDPNITTATGMSIARDSAMALVSTPLAIRAEKDQTWSWQILNLVKKNWFDQKYKFLLGKYNQSECEAFKKSKLEEDINLFVEPNSWIPQTTFEKLQNLGAFLTAFGIPLGFLNPQVPEVVRQYGGQLYNIPFDFDELAPDIRIAQKRLDKAKTIAAIEVPKTMAIVAGLVHQRNTKMDGMAGEGAKDLIKALTTTISNAMSVEEDLDEHDVFINEYTKWLKTDEGQNCDPILRQAIKLTIADHRHFSDMDKAREAQNTMAMNGGQMPDNPEYNQNQAAWQQNKVADSPFDMQQPNKIQDFSQKRN